MKTVDFVILGEPKGKGRPRFTRTGHAYTPKETVDYEKTVREAFKEQCTEFFADEQIGVRIKAYYGIPKSLSKPKRAKLIEKKPTKKPDYDNVAKIVTDALNGLAYADDKNIVEAHQYKLWAEDDNPRVEVSLYSV